MRARETAVQSGRDPKDGHVMENSVRSTGERMGQMRADPSGDAQQQVRILRK